MKKKIEWTKKKIVILIVAIIAIIGIIAGSIFAVWMLTPGQTIIKKQQIVVRNPSDTDEDDDFIEEEDFSEGETEDETLLITILKKIKRLFGEYEDETEEISYSNSDFPKKKLYAKDYGVKGDGVTDDAKAIFDAVMALQSGGPGSVLYFESDKTYYCKKLPVQYLFYFNGLEGLTVDGGGSTFLIDTLAEYAVFSKTKDCVLKNIVFDRKLKSAFRAQTLEVNNAEGWALMKADRDFGLADGEIWNVPIGSFFGVLDRHNSRYHMYVTKYQMVSKADKTFKLWFNMGDANTKSWVTGGALTTYGMIVPTPKVAHLQERGFTIANNYNFKMIDLTCHDCPRFAMYIGQNEGKLTFRNVDFVPADNDLDRDMNFTSWRDLFHVKDNRCSIEWVDCDATGNYDDIYNISSSTLYVSDYNLAKNRITLRWPEKNSNYYTIKAGDTLNIIDTITGEDCGTATVKRVVSQSNGDDIVILNKPLDNLNNVGTSVLAFFTNRCSPGSVIKNCNYNGTFRFRGPITISDTKIFNMRTWIDLFGSVEGPIPENIVYKNCEIDDGSSGTFIIGANSGNTDEFGYHVKNIRFENCKLTESRLSIYASDADYVILKGCKELDGTPIADKNVK